MRFYSSNAKNRGGLRSCRVDSATTLTTDDFRLRFHLHGGPSQAAPDLADLDDAAWIERVQEGDEDAARALVDRLYPGIIKSVRRHLPRRTSEEDLVQIILTTVFKKLSQFSGRVPLEHWVSRIAVNTCYNQMRHESVRPELRMGDLSEDEEVVVQHMACTNDQLPGENRHAARELLDRLLDRLKPKEREVIRLLHLEERSTKEVSRLTGWSIPLVKINAFRARHKMRALWKTVVEAQEA